MSVNALDESLLDIIVCPIDKEALTYSYFEDINEPVLYNPRLKLMYEIKDSIPILLEEETQALSEESFKILEANAVRKTGNS